MTKAEPAGEVGGWLDSNELGRLYVDKVGPAICREC